MEFCNSHSFCLVVKRVGFAREPVVDVECFVESIPHLSIENLLFCSTSGLIWYIDNGLLTEAGVLSKSFDIDVPAIIFDTICYLRSEFLLRSICHNRSLCNKTGVSKSSSRINVLRRL